MADALPADVLRSTFELLSQPDVLAAAAVSRAWRASAVLDVSYYRAWTVLYPAEEHSYRELWEDFPRHPHDTDLSWLEEIIWSAKNNHHRLSLTVCTREIPASSPDTEEDDGYIDPCLLGVIRLSAAQEERDRWVLADLVGSALPCLVRLSLHVYDKEKFAPEVFSRLIAPAPILRSFTIDAPTYHTCTIPVDLFAGTAPLLKEVSIIGTMPPNLSFASVRSLDLSVNVVREHLRDMAACFPGVRRLGLHTSFALFDKYGPLEANALSAYTHLRSLYVGDGMTVCDLLPALRPLIEHLPFVEFAGVRDRDALAQLLATPAPLTLELHEHRSPPQPGEPARTHLRMCFSTPTTTRVFDTLVQPERVVFRVLGLSNAAATLTRIALDDSLLLDLLRACPALPALEHLSIVLVRWPRGLESAACPRLATVELYAVRADATIAAAALQELARALGAAHAHIVLANGLALAGPQDAFASVQPAAGPFVAGAHAARVGELPAQKESKREEETGPDVISI